MRQDVKTIWGKNGFIEILLRRKRGDNEVNKSNDKRKDERKDDSKDERKVTMRRTRITYTSTAPADDNCKHVASVLHSEAMAQHACLMMSASLGNA